jgi:hypothetical protein
MVRPAAVLASSTRVTQRGPGPQCTQKRCTKWPWRTRSARAIGCALPPHSACARVYGQVPLPYYGLWLQRVLNRDDETYRSLVAAKRIAEPGADEAVTPAAMSPNASPG